jgi:uncharacterized protein with FMN-binding domain
MKIALVIVGAIIVLTLLSFVFGTMGMRDIKKMVISEVDLSKVPDGVYKGTFHKTRWNYDVEVNVKDHKIISIKNIKKLPGTSQQKLVDEAAKAMLAKQSVKIDVVSGATIDTKAFQKAVENALTQGTK